MDIESELRDNLSKNAHPLNQICRACFSFPVESTHDPDTIWDWTRIRLSKDADFSTGLCLRCDKELLTARNFRLRCTLSERLLKSRIAFGVEHIKVEPDPTLEIEETQLTTSEINNAKIESDTAAEKSKKSRNRKQYGCATCGRKFSRKSNLDHHEKTHTGEKPFTCDACGKSYADKRCFERHALMHKGERSPFACSSCRRSFTCRSALERHELVHRAGPQYACDACGKLFALKSSLVAHVRIHLAHRPFACAACGKRFRRKEHLASHATSHDAARPHVCEACGARYKSAPALAAHARAHTGERPYACGACARAFRTASALRGHARALHATGAAADSRPYACDVCERAFRAKCNLTKHRLGHGGPKPHGCGACAKAFPFRYLLKRHMNAVHVGQRQPESKQTHRPPAVTAEAAAAVKSEDFLVSDRKILPT